MAVRTLNVRVKPRAQRDEFVLQPDGSWLARVKAPPVDDKANQALVALVAAHFDCPRKSVRIRRGMTSRTKVLEIED